MKAKGKEPSPERKAELIAGLRRDKIERDNSYRARALKLFPHICASCSREFTHKNLSELTVHHKDHNHDNNPNDGSNWELLCIYCHDNEHEKTLKSRVGGTLSSKNDLSPSIFSQFEGLDSLLNKDDES